MNERAVCWKEIAEENPKKYHNKKRNFQERFGMTFFLWLFSAFVQGTTLMSMVMYGYTDFLFERRPYTTSIYDNSTLVYSNILFVIYLKLMVELERLPVCAYVVLIVVMVFYIIMLTLAS